MHKNNNQGVFLDLLVAAKNYYKILKNLLLWYFVISEFFEHECKLSCDNQFPLLTCLMLYNHGVLYYRPLHRDNWGLIF